MQEVKECRREVSIIIENNPNLLLGITLSLV